MSTLSEVTSLIFLSGMYITALLNVVQIVKILQCRSAKGISALAYIGFFLLSCNATLYSILFKQPTWTTPFAVSALTGLIIVYFALRYKK